MADSMQQARALEALREWRQVAVRRDALIRDAVAAGAGDTAIHAASGVSRTIIARIRDPHGPVAVGQAAREATRAVSTQVVIRTVAGQVRLYLPLDEDRNPRDEWVRRMNLAGGVLVNLADAGLAVECSTQPDGRDVQEHLAALSEQYVILTKTEEN